MKLFLTSSGITNKSLAKALKHLVRGKIHIAFIPTAANVQKDPKDWLIRDYVNCEKLGTVDIVDISALPKSVWLPRLQKANVLFMGGGNTIHLMHWIKKSGLQKELPNLLKKRIYVGISAGSIVLSKKLTASSQFLYGKKTQRAPPGLGYVDFHVRPHLNSVHFPKVLDKYLKTLNEFDSDLYAIDDDSGILYINNNIKVISEGKWKKYTPHHS